MDTLLQQLFASVSAERLRELTLALVSIPSPTGDSKAVTELYARTVRSLGVDVEITQDFPSSPSTIARWPGPAGGRTLTLDGHLDTIHAAHPRPYVEGEHIYGRGAGDMKSGVAAMVEALRVLVEQRVPLAGNLILATHSLHEAPVGHMEGLRALIARGDVFVDAALVAEGRFDELAFCGKGQALYEIEVTRAGEVLHENVARRTGVLNPLDHAVRLASRLLARHAELQRDEPDTQLGVPTFFLGQVHGGDFYNRVPTRAMLNGTYRFGPQKTWADVRAEFDALLASAPCPADLDVTLRLASNGLGFQVPREADIVRALRAAYRRVVGRELPLVGELSVSDVNILAREAGIPTVAHGTGSSTAHADLEWVDLPNIVRSAKVYLACIVEFLGLREG